MKKFTFILLPALIAPLALMGNSKNSNFIKADAGFIPNLYEETAEVYYKDIDPSVHPYQLLGDIKDLTDKNHLSWCNWDDFGKNHNYRYTDYIIGENPKKHFRDFYSTTLQPIQWDGNKYSREHVWCAQSSNDLWARKCSDGKDHSKDGAGIDVHHIRPLLKGINSSRSDQPFTEFDKDSRIERTSSTGIHFGWKPASGSSDFYEPLDEMKGDIARILMYIFVHYNTPESIGRNLPCPTNDIIGDNSFVLKNNRKEVRRGDLHMQDIIVKDPNVTPTAQSSFEILLKWHNQDPVSDWETIRNDGAYGMQGNRNPFIDHPEWADYVFAENVDEATPPEVETPDSSSGDTTTQDSSTETPIAYTLDNFEKDFMSLIICDGGKTPPSKDNWKKVNQLYNKLSDVDKELLKTVSTTHEKYGKMLERYDYIVKKYGIDQYANYMGRVIANETIKAPMQTTSLTTTDLLVIISSVSLVSITLIVTIYLVIRKRIRR